MREMKTRSSKSRSDREATPQSVKLPIKLEKGAKQRRHRRGEKDKKGKKVGKSEDGGKDKKKKVEETKEQPWSDWIWDENTDLFYRGRLLENSE